MTYRNTLGGSGRLIVRYDFLNEEYRAEKFVDGRSVGRIENRRWAAFLPVSRRFVSRMANGSTEKRRESREQMAGNKKPTFEGRFFHFESFYPR